MSGLNDLLRFLRPRLNPGTYAFCPLPAGAPCPHQAVGWFREREGESVILPVEDAREFGWPVTFEAAWMTFDVESDLDAVGLTAVVATALADAGIACNVVAALRHDHLFVPADRADEAVRILNGLAARSPEPPPAL